MTNTDPIAHAAAMIADKIKSDPVNDLRAQAVGLALVPAVALVLSSIVLIADSLERIASTVTNRDDYPSSFIGTISKPL